MKKSPNYKILKKTNVVASSNNKNIEFHFSLDDSLNKKIRNIGKKNVYEIFKKYENSEIKNAFFENRIKKIIINDFYEK